MQNIKNFWHADPEISALRTNGRADEAEFIGPFQLKPWVQKYVTKLLFQRGFLFVLLLIFKR